MSVGESADYPTMIGVPSERRRRGALSAARRFCGRYPGALAVTESIASEGGSQRSAAFAPVGCE